jgi:hypothetical protein
MMNQWLILAHPKWLAVLSIGSSATGNAAANSASSTT